MIDITVVPGTSPTLIGLIRETVDLMPPLTEFERAGLADLLFGADRPERAARTAVGGVVAEAA